MTPSILVMGAGAWGTALAVHFAKRAAPSRVALWGRDAQQMQHMADQRENSQYLPGVRLPDALGVTADLDAAGRQWRASSTSNVTAPQGIRALVVLATPMAGLREAAQRVRHALGPAHAGEGLVWLAKGLQQQSGSTTSDIRVQWPHEIVASACPDWIAGALTGPSFAQEVAAGLPVALTIASHDMDWARRVAQTCHGHGMRMYATSDVIGVELGGAMKNVLAIAAGVCDGLELGANARAALLTRGLAEMSRLGMAIGAQAPTFLGLATLGDLILTATGDLSRNRRVGLGLAKGESLQDIVKRLGHVAEGVATAPALVQLARTANVEVPITESVCHLMSGQWSAQQAIAHLMSRDPRDEHGH